MKATIEYDLESERDRRILMETLSGTDLDNESDSSGSPRVDTHDSLTEDHQALYEAVKDNPNHALRIYHRALADDDRTSYNDADTGWNSERADIQQKMRDLRDHDYVELNNQAWVPA